MDLLLSGLFFFHNLGGGGGGGVPSSEPPAHSLQELSPPTSLNLQRVFVTPAAPVSLAFLSSLLLSLWQCHRVMCTGAWCKVLHPGFQLFKRSHSLQRRPSALQALLFLSGSWLEHQAHSAFFLWAACVSGCSSRYSTDTISKCWFHASHFPWLHAPS